MSTRLVRAHPVWRAAVSLAAVSLAAVADRPEAPGPLYESDWCVIACAVEPPGSRASFLKADSRLPRERFSSAALARR